jgi:two-component system chemotaxis sensor kinase CheA
MPKKIDDDTREIINSFVSEGYERLDDSETQLSRLGNGDDAGKLHSVFRLFHSVKGSAGYLGFENIKHLTHEAETLLEAFLKEKFAMSQESLDVIFATIDSLRGMIAVIEKEFTDEASRTRLLHAATRSRRTSRR